MQVSPAKENFCGCRSPEGRLQVDTLQKHQGVLRSATLLVDAEGFSGIQFHIEGLRIDGLR